MENIGLCQKGDKEGDFALLTLVIGIHELSELQHHICFYASIAFGQLRHLW